MLVTMLVELLYDISVSDDLNPFNKTAPASRDSHSAKSVYSRACIISEHPPRAKLQGNFIVITFRTCHLEEQLLI